MANVLSEREQRKLENQRRWAMRNKEESTTVKSHVTRQARINELRDMILSTAHGRKLVEKVMEIAMDDNHQGQMAAMKMVIDRIIPQSTFEATKDAPRAAIQINITGLGGTQTMDVMQKPSNTTDQDNPDDDIEDVPYYQKPQIVAVPGYVEVTDEEELRKLVDGEDAT